MNPVNVSQYHLLWLFDIWRNKGDKPNRDFRLDKIIERLDRQDLVYTHMPQELTHFLLPQQEPLYLSTAEWREGPSLAFAQTPSLEQ